MSGSNLDWKCVGDLTSPMTRINGEVACLSYNGKDCAWSACKNGKPILINFFKPKPLICGADHKAKYGSTGYNNPEHWCSKVDKLIPGAPAPVPVAAAQAQTQTQYDWKCIGDIKAPMTRINGEVACLSYNNRDCEWDACKNGKLTISATREPKPLLCGADHKAKHGSTGYDNPEHWCSKVNNAMPIPQVPVAPPASPSPVSPAPVSPPVSQPPVKPSPVTAVPVPVASSPSTYKCGPAPSSSKPKRKPIRRQKKKQSTSDYIFYLIDIIASIIAITLALITTANKDHLTRLTHLVLAIMFRYLYLAYIVLRRFSIL